MDRMATTQSELFAALAVQREAFRGAAPPRAAERQAHLRTLATLLKDRRMAIVRAISEDFGHRAPAETLLAEIMPLLAACAHASRHVAGWMRPRRRAVGRYFQPASNWVEYQPLGVVGVVAPWNYPIFLTVGPLIDILAAGNRCLIKCSELTPATSSLLGAMLADGFPPEQVSVIEGGPEMGRAFCALPFDHLVFTGSTGVGREVMRAASANLVPVTLELGGKSPVIVAEDADPAVAGRSVAVGKFFNAGQTCTAPDYALVPEGRVERFAASVLQAAEAMYPALEDNPDYTAIISERHHARLAGLLAGAASAGAKILQHRAPPSGHSCKFPPTVVLNPPLDGSLMQEEIFGPVLAVAGTASLEAAIGIVRSRPHPLALYIYTGCRETERAILRRTISGGVTVNSTIMHTGQPDLPFGGVGLSGMGAYHGQEGFLRFSHARGVHKRGFFSGFEFLKPPHGRTAKLALRAMGLGASVK